MVYIHTYIHFADPLPVVRQLNMKQIMTKQQIPQTDMTEHLIIQYS